MTMREKLMIHRQIERENKRKIRDWKEALKRRIRSQNGSQIENEEPRGLAS